MLYDDLRGRNKVTSFTSFHLTERVMVAAGVLLTLVAFVLHILGRSGFPFWPDEAYTVLAVRAPSWAALLSAVLRNEETPPLYFMLLRVWAFLWNDSREGTLRLFSALFAATTVPCVIWLSSRMWSRTIGLTGGALFAVNPFIHYYAQEARAYTLALFWISVLLLGAHCYLKRPTAAAWLVYVIAGSAGLYTNYFTAFTLAGMGGLVGLLLLRSSWQAMQLRFTLFWVAAQATIIILFTPWLPSLLYQVEVSGATLAAEQRDVLRQALLSLFVLGAGFPDGSVVSLSLVVIVGIAVMISAFRTARQADRSILLFSVGAVVIPVICVSLMFRNDGQFHPRYMLLSLPMYTGLIAAALSKNGRLAVLRRSLLAFLLALSVVYCFTMQPDVKRRGGWDRIAAVVAREADSDDAVFFAPPWAKAAFIVQYSGPGLTYYGADSFAEYYYEGGRPFAATTFEHSALEAHLQSGGTAWIVVDHNYGVRPSLPAAAVIEDQRFGSTSLIKVASEP